MKQTIDNDNDIDIDCCATEDDGLEGEGHPTVGLHGAAVRTGTDFELVVLKRDDAVLERL